MSTVQGDVAEVDRAARDLTAAVDRLARSHPETLDLRRLVEDVARVREDLSRLTGEPATPAPVWSGRSGPGDTSYDPRQFDDGAYEDYGPRSR